MSSDKNKIKTEKLKFWMITQKIGKDRVFILYYVTYNKLNVLPLLTVSLSVSNIQNPALLWTRNIQESERDDVNETSLIFGQTGDHL